MMPSNPADEREAENESKDDNACEWLRGRGWECLTESHYAALVARVERLESALRQLVLPYTPTNPEEASDIAEQALEESTP